MGEANYFMKIRPPLYYTPAEIDLMYDAVKVLMRELQGAYDYWQDNRSIGDTPTGAWDRFAKKFPRGRELLADVKDFRNGPSGTLTYADEVLLIGGVIHLRGNSLWHGTDWQPLASYIEAIWPGSKTAWVSDEYVDPFDVLEV